MYAVSCCPGTERDTSMTSTMDSSRAFVKDVKRIVVKVRSYRHFSFPFCLFIAFIALFFFFFLSFIGLHAVYGLFYIYIYFLKIVGIGGTQWHACLVDGVMRRWGFV